MALTTVPASLSATALTLTTAAQPNITSVGTLTGLTVSGNIAGTLTTAAQTNITSVGTLSSLTVSGALNGTLSTAAQTNITSVGTLTGLAVTGDTTITKESPAFTLTDSSSSRTLLHFVDDNNSVVRASGPLLLQSGGAVSTITLDASQRVGINNGSPSAKLDVVANDTVWAGEFTQSNTSNGDGVIVTVGSTAAADYALSIRSNAGNTPGLNVKADGTVGIGTFTPGALLDVGGGSIADPTIRIDSAAGGDPTLIFDGSAANRSALIKFYDNGSNVGGFIDYLHNGDKMNFGAGSAVNATMTVTDGQVGIGTDSPQSFAKLEVAGTAGAQTGANQALYVRAATATANQGVGIRMSAASGSHEAVGIIGMVNNASGNAGSMTFHTYNLGATIPEAMRITNDGKVLIGKTTIAFGTAGVRIDPTNIQVTSNQSPPAYFSRLSNDGHVAEFYKDTTQVGAVSVKSGDLAIHSTTTNHVGLVFGNTRIEPANNYGTTSHNTVDLGNTDRGFKNLYLTSAIRWYVSGVQKAYHVYDGTNMMNYGGSGVGHEWYAGGNRAMLLTSDRHLLNYATSVAGQGVTTYGNGANGHYISCTGTCNYWVTNHGQSSTTGTLSTFYNNTTAAGGITIQNTSDVVYGGTSDYRRKENVADMVDATARLKQLRPITFNWIDGGVASEGFLAHEVQTIVPTAVTGVKDQVFDEEDAKDDPNVEVGGIKNQLLDPAKLVPMLVKAMQEQQALIEALQTEVAALKGG